MLKVVLATKILSLIAYVHCPSLHPWVGEEKN